jgi:hypothetical protein
MPEAGFHIKAGIIQQCITVVKTDFLSHLWPTPGPLETVLPTKMVRKGTQGGRLCELAL